MVRFGTLETRLTRAVQVTCQEENKKAVELLFENGECGVEHSGHRRTRIEPLIDLLKNAAVHGIENEETRRLIGKPDKGQIRIRVDSDEHGVTLAVSDDGRGISEHKAQAKGRAGRHYFPRASGSNERMRLRST